MKKRMLSLLTVTISLFLPFALLWQVTDDVNLIVNGGFETGDHTGWSAFNSAIIDTTSPHTGTYCAKVDKNSSYEQTVSLAPNTKYVLTGWAKSENSAVMTLDVKNYGGQGVFFRDRISRISKIDRYVCHKQ